MIYTVTPNPALDLSGTVDQLIPNEKTYVHDETRFPGGNAINAARMIRKFRQPVVATGFLGGPIGEEVKNLLNHEGVQTDFIPIQGNTRISVTVSNQTTHLQTRLSFPGPRILKSEIIKLNKWADSITLPALGIIGGSLPQGFLFSHLKKFILNLRRQNIPFVLDMPGKLLRSLIPCQPSLIKPNLLEFQELVEKNVTTVSEVVLEANRLIPWVPLICVSSVEGGALFITKQDIWFGKIPKVHVKTTVGAGDSMVGAMCAQIWKNKLFHSKSKDSNLLIQSYGEQILRWGLAAATATLVTPGTMLGSYSDILRYYSQVQIKKYHRLDLV